MVVVASSALALVTAACGGSLGASTASPPGGQAPSTLLPGRAPATSVLAPPITIAPLSTPSDPGRPADTGHVGTTDGGGVSTGVSQDGDPDGFYRAPAGLSPAPPGSLIRSEVLDTAAELPPGATAYRVVYDSASVTGVPVAVSGVIVVPAGIPPPGGFPIVSWAHATTGLSARCAPSLTGVAGIPSLTAWLEARRIVVATDYPGLGVPGPDSYLVGQSEAQSVLDIARAARNLEGRAASNKVLVVGYSQGGQAALFAGQIAPSYAPELFLVGVVAVAPVASITELAPVVPTGRDDPDAGFAAMALTAWSATYGDIPLSSVLTRQAERAAGVMTTSCSGAVGAVYDATPADRLFRPGWSTDPGLRMAEVANQPGHAPTTAPVLVVQGTADDLTTYGTTTRLVTGSLCRDEDDIVRYVTIAGAGHQGALLAGQATILQWMTDRLAGRAPTDSCPRPSPWFLG